MSISKITGAVLLVMGLSLQSMAFAENTPTYSTTATPISELLDNPKTRVVMDRYFPSLADHPQASMFRGMTLKDIQPFSDGRIQDKQLEAVDHDLAKLK